MNAYSPPFALHVLGEYEDRPVEWDTGELPEQQWRVRCTHCGDEFRGVCTTGAVRSKINKFAALHLHRDPFG